MGFATKLQGKSMFFLNMFFFEFQYMYRLQNDKLKNKIAVLLRPWQIERILKLFSKIFTAATVRLSDNRYKNVYRVD